MSVLQIIEEQINGKLTAELLDQYRKELMEDE